MPDSVVQLTIRGTLRQQARENVQTWLVDGHTEENRYFTAIQLITAWKLNVMSFYLDCIPEDYQITAWFARVIGPDGGSYATDDAALDSYPGTRGTTSIAENVCPCITLIPPMGTKSAGKIFMPCVSEDDYSLNAPAAGYITAIDAYMAANTAGFASSGGVAKLGIYSRKTNLVSDVMSWRLSPFVGYQRNRARPMGP